MLTYSMEDRDGLPLYAYLYRCIRRDILSGKLRAGEKLPSKRQLAAHLGVSVMTVENAFSQLVMEGCVEARERRGYFVAPDCAAPGSSGAGRPYPREAPPEPWFADLRQGAILPEQFPFSVWAKLMRTVLSERSPALLAPMPGKGLWALREAIAAFLRRYRGMEVFPEQVVVAAGTELLYGMLPQLLGRTRLFAVEDPGYPRISQAYRADGVQTAPLPLDGQGVSVRALEASGAEAVHLSPAHHFPTGLVTSAARRRELLAWCQAGRDRYLIEDDYDSELRFSGRPLPTLQSGDRAGRVIYLNTFTKTLSPALRIGYLVLPHRLLPVFEERLGFSSCTVPSFEQLTLAKFISQGYFESHLARTRNFYRRSRDAMIAAIRESPLGARGKILEADAGLHFLLETGSPLEDGALIRRARALGVNVSCLSEYYARPEEAPPGVLVVNYSGVPRERMGETARRLARAAFGDD